MRQRYHIAVEGIVQGVGFRPFVYALARRHALAGYVYNDARGVTIEAEGAPQSLRDFARALKEEAPPLACVERIEAHPIAPCGETDFAIIESVQGAAKQTFIAPDSCVCADCLREMNDPADRRFAYPFINCTNCGPRFTIIKDVPYDRPATTMAPFPMCPQCRREYDDPADRRFHAQPNACPICGPQVQLEIAGATWHQTAALQRAAELLRAGKIVAVKGLGGYHLACDAFNETAVQQLRERKHRWDKPFALMVPDLETARALCEVSATEAQLLASRQRPIVLLRARQPQQVAAQVAPGDKDLGLMLPYAPLHFLLLQTFARPASTLIPRPSALLMTSGNRSDEPIAYRDDEARARLAPLADAFLTHDREIFMRCDDSIARVVNGQTQMLRRARGYAPQPLPAPQPFEVPLLATGAHLKNTFGLAKDQHVFLSHHIGDLENYETLRSFEEGIEHFGRLFDVMPRAVAHDLHPDYLATKFALELELPALGVQHHHAHIAAVTGEHGIGERVIGVAFDGTGYGTDGTLWGGEFLVADWENFERVAHFGTIPLPGGEAAIRQIWRVAAAWLSQVYGAEFWELELDFVRRLDPKQWHVLRQMIEKNLNAPRSSALGRVFDAVAALLGLRDVVNYEAQAAIALERLADENCREIYAEVLCAARIGTVSLDELLRAIVDDLCNGVEAGRIAARFHNTVAALTARVCQQIRDAHGLKIVALGGGVFQNPLLLKRTRSALEDLNFEVLLPTKLPFNDGAISFGQAVVANAQLIAARDKQETEDGRRKTRKTGAAIEMTPTPVSLVSRLLSPENKRS